MNSLRQFIRLSRPMYLLGAILLYFLGTGIAHYLSGQIDLLAYLLGLAWMIVIHLSAQYLQEYFDFTPLSENQSPKRTPFSGATGAIGSGKLPRQVPLWAGLACLTVGAALTILLVQGHSHSPGVYLILGLIFIGEFVYCVPPFRLASSGYGELVMSIIMVGFIPALAYLLQGRDFHRLLIMVAFPLTTLYIGMLLALEFPDYAADLNYGIHPLLVRIGWQKGMLIHNILILGSFVILGVAIVFGLPITIALPALFVLPIGGFQVWMMYRIEGGAKPNWALLSLTAVSTFGLTTYLLTFAFWTH